MRRTQPPPAPEDLRTIRQRLPLYLLTLIAPALGAASFFAHGIAAWSLPLFSFCLVPLLELVLPARRDNLPRELEAAASGDPLFDILLAALVPVQWALLLLFLHRIGEPGLDAADRAGRIAGMGILCGIYGINAAHELGHRTRRWERALARALLLTSLYMHFIIEHNRGHHRRVATPDDPASARCGESVYAFWLRSVAFGFISAWRLEAERLRKAGRSPWSWSNEMIHAMLWQSALLAAIGVRYGTAVMAAFVAAAGIGILLLETVNYIEHYGLRRTRDEQGRFRRAQHVHSWNSDHPLGRALLFELTRHSDHHWQASRKYQVLRSVEEAPQLPTGYPGTMLLSLLPSLFFRVMDPRIDALCAANADLEKAA
jgi:alkane 1-monooxygenase